MAKSLQRAGLVAELATATGLAKEAVSDLLDKYTAIAYREAPNGFVLPGICKLTVVTKKASRCRNPATGQWLMIGERKALKIVPIKKAKDTITPRPPNLIQVMAVQPPPKPVATHELPNPEVKVPEALPQSTIAQAPMAAEQALPKHEAPQTPSVPEARPAAQPPSDQITMVDKGAGQIVFNCAGCGSMLAATPSAAGMMGECPFCGGKTEIPSRDKASAAAQPAVAGLQNDAPILADFITFICRECGQEIEAPVDMIGLEVNCPTCASILHVPAFSERRVAPESEEPLETMTNRQSPPPGVNASSMTIRIDLSDLE